MPKPIFKDISKKPIMLRLSSWGKGWWADFSSKASQAGKRFFGCLGMAALFSFIFAAASYYLFLPHLGVLFPEGPGTLEWWMQMAILTILLYVFIPYLALVFVLSLHPKTRPVADMLSLRLMGISELDKLKARVDIIESRLASMDGRIDNMETRLNTVETRLNNIESRLGSIETTLKALVSKEGEQ
jgi:uncharacterized membrane protein YqaE (UPF0057 family)